MFEGVLKSLGKITHLMDRKENYYRALAATLVIIYGFLLLSRLLIHLPDDLPDTALRKKINSGNLVVQMTDKIFFSDRNMLQVGLIIDEQVETIPKGYDTVIREKSNTKKKYKTQLIKITEDYYLLFVHHLPENWQSVSIQIYEKGESSDTVSDVQKMYVSHTKSKISDQFKQEPSAYYANQYFELLIQDNKKMIAKEYKKQRGYRSDIADVKKKISSLKDKISYQLGSKKVETQNDLSDAQSQITQLNTSIQSSKDKITELEKENALLEKKREENGYEAKNK